jgi:hypothetical protein
MKGSSFRRSSLFWLGVTILVSGIIVMRTFHVTRGTQSTYDALQREALEQHAARKKGSVREFSDQKRVGVEKRIWLSEKDPRIGMQLHGTVSNIHITTFKSETALTEEFQDAHGVIQEELFWQDAEGCEYITDEAGVLKKKSNPSEEVTSSRAELLPMQRFRYFESDHALYDYSSNTLTAYDARFWTYLCSGHDLVTNFSALKPISSGTATSMTMCHEGAIGSVQFAAENLKLHLTQ